MVFDKKMGCEEQKNIYKLIFLKIIYFRLDITNVNVYLESSYLKF